MYEFWCHYVKPKYVDRSKLYYTDTESFLAYIKTDDIYKDISENIETRFDTSNYEFEGKNEKVNGLMKDELVRKVMTKFVGLSAKTYSYVIDDGSEDRKSKKHKKVCHKKKT